MEPSATERTPIKQRVSIVARKVIVTVVVGVFGYMLTENALNDGPLAVMASVFLGGVAFVTQFLVDTERKLDGLQRSLEHEIAALRRDNAEHLEALREAHSNHQRKLDGHIRRTFRQISEATELHALVSDSPLPAQAVSDWVRAAVQVSKETPELTSQVIQSEIRRGLTFMRELHNGAGSYDGEDRDWLLNLAKLAENSIKATSLATVDSGTGAGDGGLWQTDLGMRYLDYQEQAIRRGVTVQRIFIIDIPQLNPRGPLADVLQRQRARGVEVRVLNPLSMHRAEVNANALYDFIVFDDQVTYETISASRADLGSAPYIRSTRVGVDPTRTAEHLKHFETLWKIATEVSDQF
ncbi:hypothetical protein LX16_4574 [Stackebrandtia albiflava]|uniref:Uncharacterized protein n=1 Tax=Stackebrandtia albiflava TaxID=406432 RepID=A0A562URV2_9ACTN|nr:hypothetical protein LX16_4574 [Stackebrandtia albiflava]